MKLLVDMNLPPSWLPLLEAEGHAAVHWSSIGAHNAPDPEVLGWARQHQHVLFTHDLDFGAILAATHSQAPSVVQIRTQDVTPMHAGKLVADVLRRFACELSQGAIVSVDEDSARVRVLPL